MTGIITSLIIKSGTSCKACSNPSCPLPASITMYLSVSILCRNMRNSGLSSTIRMVRRPYCPIVGCWLGACYRFHVECILICCNCSLITVGRDKFHLRSCSKISRLVGNCTLKQLPLPGWLDTSIIPWCSSTNSLTNDKPIPDDGCNMLYWPVSRIFGKEISAYRARFLYLRLSRIWLRFPYR